MGVLNDRRAEEIETENKVLKFTDAVVIQGGNRKILTLPTPFFWSRVILSIKFSQMYTNLTIQRNLNAKSHYAFMWGDVLSTTSSWKYQYVAKVELLNPSDSEVTVNFVKVGFYTFSLGFPPNTWTTKNNHLNYQIESIVIE